MTPTEYLEKVLAREQLEEGCSELDQLRQERDKIRAILLAAFTDPKPSVREGGSKKKGTMIKVAYDLDLQCYFPADDSRTLKEIYNDTAKALEGDYLLQRKTSALRLQAKSPQRDLRIDVVPGRFVDDSQTDVWLYQESADKGRQKTNPGIHISHVRESGVRPAIKLMKLWAYLNGVQIKTFILELLTIKLLADRKGDDLPAQLRHIWGLFRDDADGLSVKDPANPEGNDLKPALDAARWQLSTVAGTTLTVIENSGWAGVFGPVDGDEGEGSKVERLRSAPAVVTRPSKPWYSV